jgi:ferredoxin
MSSRPDKPVDGGRRAFLRGRFFRRDRVQADSGPTIAVLDRNACLAWNGVICISCRTACDEQAIRFDPLRQPSIVDEACTGCGACINVCPPFAIHNEPAEQPG